MKKLLCALLVLPLALFLWLNIHELGHTLAAYLLGDHEARYALYLKDAAAQHPGPSGACIGCTFYDEDKLSLFGNVLVTVAGLLASQLAALLLLRLASAWLRPDSLRRFLLRFVAWILSCDVMLQVGQALGKRIGTQTRISRVDLADTLYLLHSGYGWPLSWLYIGLVLAALTYLLVFYVLLLRSRGRSDPMAVTTIWPDGFPQ